MKRPQSSVVLAAAALAASSQGAWPAEEVRPADAFKPANVPSLASELLAPRFRATGHLSLVRKADNLNGGKEEVLRDFGAGALAERQAYADFAALAGKAPVIVKRVWTHYRCPSRSIDGIGRPSNFDCDAVKIHYTPLAADPTDPKALAVCNVSVDADVLYLGRRVRTISWALDPVSPPATTSAGKLIPRFKLFDWGLDPSGDEVRGITFSDNNDFPRERGVSTETMTGKVFDSPVTTADGQQVTWTRATAPARRDLAKVFYYAVVLQVWSDTLQDYVFCEPYDPTIPNRGN